MIESVLELAQELERLDEKWPNKYTGIVGWLTELEAELRPLLLLPETCYACGKGPVAGATDRYEIAYCERHENDVRWLEEDLAAEEDQKPSGWEL